MVANYQYPQYLYCKSTGEAAQGPNGSWAGASPEWILVGICREETNGKGTSIQTADGRFLVFSSLVYLPRGSAKVQEGSEILIMKEKAEVVNEGEAILKGTCLKFDDGRLHCRMWV
jgi:hypothetical protein